MSKFKVGDLVYIPPFDYVYLYDNDRPSYEITEIMQEDTWENVGGTYNVPVKSYKYKVNNGGRIETVDQVMGLPNLKINGIDILDFRINGNNITKIKKDEGEWVFVQGKGYQPTHPNRHIYTLSDNSDVESDAYHITNVMTGGRSRTRKNKHKHKKSRKLRRKTKRSHK